MKASGAGRSTLSNGRAAAECAPGHDLESATPSGRAFRVGYFLERQSTAIFRAARLDSPR